MEEKFHLVNVEPYTSELYDSLLRPAFESVRQSYLKYGKRKILQGDLMKKIAETAVRGCLIGTSRSIFTVAKRNLKKQYDSRKDPNVPIDIFYIRQYTDPKNFPQIFNGLKSEIAVENSYQIGKGIISTLSKYYGYIPSESFMTTLGVVLGRAYGSTFISSLTIYPAAMKLFTNTDTEEIARKSIKRATVGAVTASLISVGISICQAVLPSYKKIISIGFSTLGG
ncbi:hypothetical protein GPJ56_008107 [Histomonas meleagridis]|uniref:uncharacterized protein n=1 Tax=Histomonas meleagridis TaxID=135588 RepID=UPI00355A9286|nr:hypothetical protein GPJ56_008107 [Histomonas meleagridis]KAH0798942.1 hypothetical protein GO595_008232 [Histomonas meleagridis]